MDDPRLTWLSSTFIEELDNWKANITGSTAAEREKKFLSNQTYSGLVMTSRAMTELIQFLLLSSPADSYVLSKRINQNP